MLEKKIYLVNVKPSAFTHHAVANDTVEHAVQHHQHSYRQKLFAEVTDVITENPGIGVHIGGLCERIQGAFREQFDSQRHVAGLLLRLIQQRRVEIL